ncbi:hypothetical protein BIY24_09835 [Halobacteriovorax marinus]|uniref:S8 family peptidase n=1 Tax=Halobacteriovorax marinus TaxID=97084 RepID=UPI000BC2F0DE|nr:S8 family peptidase [Halobacteriovorax marinus]ATH08239.1 hypothetical protein BIY24_09835 [Halobacteriovorax marinus]
MISKSILSAALFLSATSFANTPDYHQGRLIVKLNKGHELPSSKLIKSSMHLFEDNYVLRSHNISALEKELRNSNAILSVNKDFYAKREALPKAVNPHKVAHGALKNAEYFNDPKVNKLWGFRPSNKKGMNIFAAYDNFDPSTTEKVIVAVVDTGVDYNHEDLRDVMWTNSGEIPGNGIDDDGNGYIDDIHGINTLVRDSDGNATMDIMDGHSHGTHVSGTIAAKQNNGIGIAGVASNVEIMGIRTVPNYSDETDVDVAEAFLYAAKNGAKIINCSFGKSHNEGGMLVKETIDYIGKEYGVLVVAAAGNSSQDIDKKLTYPASFDSENLLVVASNSKLGMSYFSNYGLKSVDVVAPGSSIYSTVPGNRYSSMSGTSMASPNTAGVAAEILSRNPGLSPLQLKTIIMNTVSKSRSFSAKTAAGGIIDLATALK